MALRDPLPMGLGSVYPGAGPKFNPMQVNQVFNECLHKEFRFQGAVKRRPFRFNIPELQSSMVAQKTNLRTKEAVREQLSKGCNSPRMIRDLQTELGKRAVTPIATPNTETRAATLCYKSVKDHLKHNGLSTGDPQAGNIRSTLQLQKMLPPERHRLPETMAQEVGWLVSGFPSKRSSGPGLGLGSSSRSVFRSSSVPSGIGSIADAEELPPEAPKEAGERPNFWWKPRRPCPETEYARLYYETLQSNPFSNAGMFPDASEKTG